MTNFGPLVEGVSGFSAEGPFGLPFGSDADVPFTVVEWGRDWSGRWVPRVVELDDGSVVSFDEALGLLDLDADEVLRRYSATVNGTSASEPNGNPNGPSAEKPDTPSTKGPKLVTTHP